jgi:Spy/CpxP family protein refolding chaperone
MLRTFSRPRAALAGLALVAGVAGVGFVTFSAGSAHADTGAATDAGGSHGRHGHGRGHHGDLLHAALRLPDLTDAQRSQIENLEKAKRAPHAAARAAHEALAQAVAAQVDANKIDRTKLTAQLKAVSDAETAVKTANAAAVTSLHGVLTPAQRTELADKVSAKIAEHEQKRAAHDAEKTADRSAKTGPEHGGPWSRALGLSPAQETQIRANLKAAGVTPPPHGGFDAQVQQELTSFKQASFTAPVAAGGPPVGRMVDMAQAALPVLTDAQRAELSNLLRGSQPEEGN